MKIRVKLIDLYSRIMASGFIKSVLTLSTGIVLAQVINFIGTPVITRIFEPSAIGDYTLIAANAGVISSVACLGMMTVFMLPSSHEEARGLCQLVTCSVIGITSVWVLILYIISDYYRLFSTERTSYNISLAVLWLYIVFNMVSSICYAYVNRMKYYKVMFWNPIIGAVVNISCSIVFGLLRWGVMGYTLASVLSFAANIFHLIHYANPYKKVENIEYKGLSLLKNYSRFPRYQMPANLLSSMSTQIPTQMINDIFSGEILGIYSMALRILSLPITLLAVPINRVYFREASERYNKGQDIGDFTFNILKANIKLAVIPVIVLIIWGEWIFSLLLGEQWRRAGTFAAILGISELLKFCSACTSGGFTIIKGNRTNLIFSFISVVMNVVIYAVTKIYLEDNFLLCLSLIALSGVLYNIILNGIFLKKAHFKLLRYVRFIVFYIIAPVAVSFVIRHFIA